MAAADLASDNGAPRKSGSLKATLIEFLLVTVIAAGAGVALAMINPPASPAPAPAPTPAAGAATGGKPGAPIAAASTAAPAASCGPLTSNLVDLPPVVTNIGAPADVWVRMEASIVLDGKGQPHPEIMAAEIAADELAYLRTITLAQMQGPIGLENIRQDLSDRAIVRSSGKVSEFILRTLVAQ